MYLRKYGLPKARLDKYKKGTASEYPWTSNMVHQAKHCCNMNSGTFISFIDQCEGSSV